MSLKEIQSSDDTVVGHMHYTGNYWSNLNGTVNGQNNLGQKTVLKINVHLVQIFSLYMP